MFFLTILTTLSLGLLIGVELCVSAFINPVIWQLPPAPQASTIRMFAARLGKAMPPWYILTFVLLIVFAIAYRHTSGEPLLVAACVLWVLVIIATLMFLVPINNRMARLTPDTFTDIAQRDHKRWDTLHRLRIVTLTVAMICFLVGI